MCGICGYVSPRGADPVERELLERMNEMLRHRGPDSEGYYVDARVGLAVRRLAIIDIAGGQQPITNEAGDIHIVFNGEIYNFRELRQELEECGHHFATKSDTEVIVHAYEQWGDDCLARFNGMFAIALWDSARERLLLARDRMGKKPLYWCFTENRLIWGSEAKALLAVPWSSRRINPIALHHYLTLQYVPDPLTIFDGMHRLEPARKLVIERDGPPQVSRWWQLEFEPKCKISDGDAIAQARSLLSAAVERRLISEVPLGAFLSGGIDSSIIVALMAERAGEHVKTFSIGFEESRYSETQYARLVANQYETDHHEFTFRPEDLIGAIEGVVAVTDEPFADPAALPLYELARQARQHVTVALCGDGGDETLAGYRRYSLDGRLQPYAALPTWLTQRVVPAATAWLPEPAWIPEDANPLTGLKRLGQFSAVTRKASLVRWGSYFGHREKMGLYSDRWRDELGGVDTAEFIAARYDEARASSPLDRTLYADHVTYLAGDLLPKTDHVTMAHSLEARAPLLDAEWVEWTARLPERFKVRGSTTKWLLKAAFRDKLPSAILDRGKQGFSIPIGVWLKRELRDWTRTHLLEINALSEWFRPAAVERLMREHDTGRVNHGKRLWALLMFSLWLERYPAG